ncbi:MAG: hypothetical protein EOM14_08470 [Clostridia bacterium]|nr:hypothetical protein [Clostridia bacterium]
MKERLKKKVAWLNNTMRKRIKKGWKNKPLMTGFLKAVEARMKEIEDTGDALNALFSDLLEVSAIVDGYIDALEEMENEDA